jgi:hypothetical protein
MIIAGLMRLIYIRISLRTTGQYRPRLEAIATRTLMHSFCKFYGVDFFLEK